MNCLCLCRFAFNCAKYCKEEDFISCSRALNKSCHCDSFVTQSTALSKAMNYSSWEMTSSYRENFIQLYKLAMVCSKQKHLDAHFNTSAAERWTNEEPEAKKYCPFNGKYDQVYIKFGFISTIVAHQSLSNGSQQWSNETIKNTQTFGDQVCTSQGKIGGIFEKKERWNGQPEQSAVKQFFHWIIM